MPESENVRSARPHAPVMVIEDDPDQRDAVVLALESEGYAVVAAGSGVEALEVLESGSRPCMILLDLMMPEMDGIDFRRAQLASASLAEIPVVVMSAFGQLTRAKYLRVADYLPKPLDYDRLLSVVERVTQPV